MSGEPVTGVEPAATIRPGVMGRLSTMLRRDFGRMVITGVPHLFAALVLTQGISIIRRVLLARMLSVEELGQMTYVMQIADFVTIVADLGICTAVLKYAAEPVSDERKRQIYMTGLFSGTLTASVVGLLYMAAVLLLRFDADQAVQMFMLMVAPYIPLTAIVRTPLVFMQARKEIKRASRYTAITQVISLLMLVGATRLYGLWGFFITVTVAPLSNLVILLTATRGELRWLKPSRRLVGELVSFGWVSMLTNAIGIASVSVTVILLRHITQSDAQVGLFGIAMMVLTGTRLLPNALLQVAFPYLSELLSDPARLRKKMIEIRIKQTALMAGICLAWLALGYYALLLVFGQRYESAFWPASILMLGQLPFAWYAPQGHILVILSRIKANMCISAVILASSATLGAVLIPSYGSLGAALSVTLAQFIALVPSSILARRALSAALRSRGDGRVPAAG